MHTAFVPDSDSSKFASLKNLVDRIFQGTGMDARHEVANRARCVTGLTMELIPFPTTAQRTTPAQFSPDNNQFSKAGSE